MRTVPAFSVKLFLIAYSGNKTGRAGYTLLVLLAAVCRNVYRVRHQHPAIGTHQRHDIRDDEPFDTHAHPMQHRRCGDAPSMKHRRPRSGVVRFHMIGAIRRYRSGEELTRNNGVPSFDFTCFFESDEGFSIAFDWSSNIIREKFRDEI